MLALIAIRTTDFETLSKIRAVAKMFRADIQQSDDYPFVDDDAPGFGYAEEFYSVLQKRTAGTPAQQLVDFVVSSNGEIEIMYQSGNIHIRYSVCGSAHKIADGYALDVDTVTDAYDALQACRKYIDEHAPEALKATLTPELMLLHI